MKKILSLISLLMLFFLGVQAQTTKTWDFTQAMSEADVANLTADENWSYTESSKRYENKAEVSGELKVNGKVLEWTKGISFGTFAKGKLRLDNQKRLCLNGKGLSFTITTKKGAKLTIESQTASSGNTTRFLSATNLTVTSGFAAGNEKETNEGTVNEDGEVTITTNEGGINLYSIVLVEPEEETPTGDDVVSYTITMKDSGTSSDSGTRVTDIANTIADGSQYVSGIVNDNVFPAREGRGVKLGTSKKIGSITLTLAKKVKPLQIVVKARKYNDKGENYIKINDKEFELSEGDGEDCVVKYDGETSVSEIVITTTETDKKFRTYVLGITVTYVDKAELISETFDFNSVADAAVSNSSNAGDIVKTHKIVDKEGKNPSNATLEITPNTNATDYPADAVNVSRFVLTEAGPQLRLSGGYNGMTIKITKGTEPLRQINFHQTNWSRNTKADKGVFNPQTGVWTGNDENDVTFTIKADTTEVWADGKLQEIVLHDMGQLWLNRIEINRSDVVVIDAADGTDIGAVVAAEMENLDYIPLSIELNLAAGGNYTTSKVIEIPVPLTINGNGATIDASSNSQPFVQFSPSPVVENINDYYRLNNLTISNVTVKNVKNSILYDNKQKYCIVDFTIDNCVFELKPDAVEYESFIAFYSGGIKDMTIKNSTFYSDNTVAKYFIRYNNSARIDRYGFKDAADTWSFTYKNNTFYGLLNENGQWGNYNGVSQKPGQLILTVVDNIWYNCDKQTMRRLNQSKNFSNFNAASSMNNNTFYYDGGIADQGSYGNGTDLNEEPKFANAAAGDFTLGDCAQKTNKTGDPRWLGGSGAGEVTGIENVKNATVEDGAWYTVSGQRVAQPTKGLYIHNGKKVVIK